MLFVNMQTASFQQLVFVWYNYCTYHCFEQVEVYHMINMPVQGTRKMDMNVDTGTVQIISLLPHSSIDTE